MNEIGTIIKAAQNLIPPEAQEDLISQLGTSEKLEACPAGAILMGMYVLEYIGFPKYINELTGEINTSIEHLRYCYQEKLPTEKPMVPSTGIILSLMVADMIAFPRDITRTYKIEEMAKIWYTGPLLGIEPSLLNDDRILRAMSILGVKQETMHEVLFKLVVDVCKKEKIPLNTFILDTTVLELSGKFEGAPKVKPGRGRNSFSQLITSLVVASGSKLPVGFGVLPGGTNDSTTLPDAYETVNRIADDGAVEFLMDRIYPTASNIHYLKEHEDERMVYWIGPFKMGLSVKESQVMIDEAYQQNIWESVGYRSTKEIAAKIEPPITAFEGTWTVRDVIKPELEPGQKRRPKGSIQNVDIVVRVVFYRHALNAERETAKRNLQKEELDKALQNICGKLNQRKYKEMNYCEKKLEETKHAFSGVEKFVQCQLTQAKNNAISLTWLWDEKSLEEEKKYDGIFALLTNYPAEQVDKEGLLRKYRSRDQIEMDFKAMKGLLDLDKIVYQLPERIDTYIFLKVIAFFVLAFLRTHATKAGIKTTEKKIQENMGDMLLVETSILPLGIKTYGLARDTELNRLFRNSFSLPDPFQLIKVLGEAEIELVDHYILSWYEKKLTSNTGTQ